MSELSHKGIAGNHLDNIIRIYQIYIWDGMYMCPEQDSNLILCMSHWMNYEAADLTTQPPWLDLVAQKFGKAKVGRG